MKHSLNQSLTKENENTGLIQKSTSSPSPLGEGRGEVWDLGGLYLHIKKILIILLSFALLGELKADEGMWMLPLIEKLNIQKINGMGSSLTAEEIYSNQNTSIKDAIVVFGSGCTGVVVSDKGLVFTNHHCGFGAIQQHSTVEHNYLRDGFAAEKIEDEIPTPGLTVKFLVKIEDVTERVLSEFTNELSYKERNKKQDSIVSVIKKEFEKDTHYRVQVKSFYSDNEFYVFVFEEFRDIRFAYAPPSSIGKFGGDTDNWMWPRHTGDFSVFRVYSSPDGKPAKYSKENIPYSPKKFAVISNQGYQSGDFAMIMGNPGSTNRYLSSWGIVNRMQAINQARINVRGAKQEIWRSYMSANEAINIAYSSKYNRSSNYWKNSIGMNNAIIKLNILDQKRNEEKAFSDWVNQSEVRIAKYGKVLQNLEDGYTNIFPYSKAINFLRESLYAGVEMPRIASRISDLSKKNLLVDSLLKTSESFYKDYYPQVDEATFAVMLNEYKKSVDADALPDFYNVIQKKFKGDFEKYAKYVYAKSSFTTFEKLSKAIRSNKVNYKTDPALIWWNDVSSTMAQMQRDEYKKCVDKINEAEHLYEAGLKEISLEKGTPRYPDANSTMRLTYGIVDGYTPADAITYNYYSTAKGILEKEKPGDAEFDVPAELKKAIVDKNYGTYVDKRTGEMHVAFLSNNDITGGNSGSPIFNAKGELIGLAFDGNWEAMSGDIVFEPNLQRCINVDIRYVLFVMDKVYGAKRLIDELTIK